MLRFIKRHWIVYMALLFLAVALGLTTSFVLGQKWSTPPKEENINTSS